MRTTRSDLNRGSESESSKGHAAEQRRVGLQGVQALAPPGSNEKE